MKKLLLIFTIFSILILSCANRTDSDRYAKLVEQWQGREILFPEVMVDVLTGDTVDLSDADFTIFTYIDSAGCTGCKMKLALWNEFLNSVDTLTSDYEIASVVSVSVADKDELTYLIRKDNYLYPVINDCVSSVHSLNNFPEEMMFRTFLLDKHKRVVAIGNPIYNNAIADLYRAIIAGHMSFSMASRNTVSVEDADRQMGRVTLGESRTIGFTLHNQGSDTVYIRNVISSCHCTEAHTSSSFIAPGAELPVNVVFKEDSIVGEFVRTVHVYYKDFDNPTVLKVSGTVI